MSFIKIYEWGKKSPLKFSSAGVDKKLKFVEFPYRSEAVIGLAMTIFVISLILSGAAYVLFPETAIQTTEGVKYSRPFLGMFLTYTFFFIGSILAIAAYVYPVNIFYSQRMINYSEEMLKAIMRISTYISLNSSMEYAIVLTKEHLWGTLYTQFNDIVKQLRLREHNTLGEIFEKYTPIWNEVNPDFVKALRLIETASMSAESERDKILAEVQESLIIAYHTAGKRMAEDLSSKSKALVAVGVLFPIISLMLLPLVSVFMPDFLQPALLAFIYDVLFPSLLLIISLNFAARRIQVDTIRLTQSPLYRPFNIWLYMIGVMIIVSFAIPTILHLTVIDLTTKIGIENEYSFSAIVMCWFLSFGIFLASIILSYIYIRKNEKLWNEVSETEHDLPHLLQTFATYLTLNKSIESIIPEIIDDYKTHGFSKHPVVKFFSKMMHELRVSKKSIAELTKKMLPRICPSKKVSGTLEQVISFTDISQDSAGKAAKTIRSQTTAIYELDDYIRTLLSETVSLINITTSFLAPMLCAAAVLMSVAIVKSLNYITSILQGIAESFGSSEMGGLEIVKIEEIIPPSIILVIVSIYLIETVLVLSLFSSNIKIGQDNFQIIKTILSNLMGYIIFSVILLAGYYVIINYVFESVFTA